MGAGTLTHRGGWGVRSARLCSQGRAIGPFPVSGMITTTPPFNASMRLRYNWLTPPSDQTYTCTNLRLIQYNILVLDMRGDKWWEKYNLTMWQTKDRIIIIYRKVTTMQDPRSKQVGLSCYRIAMVIQYAACLRPRDCINTRHRRSVDIFCFIHRRHRNY